MEFYNYLERLPQEIKENIFKYLNLCDFLNLSLTSKSLNEAIGHASSCMNKIWIKFYSFNLKDLKSLNESARIYEKLKVNRVNRDDHFQFLIDLQQQHWKKVLIYNCEFKSFNKFYELIESFCDSVEELEISDIEILSYESERKALKFPALKRFMFRNLPTKAMEIFQVSSERIENAAFDIAQNTEGSLSLHEITYEILKASNSLTQLQLGPQYIKALFGEEKSFNFKFKLTNLLLKFPICNDLQEPADENISNFLIDQSKIKWLILMELQNDKVLTSAWNNRSNLNRISFVGLEELFNNDMEFNIEINLNLKQLDLISRKVLISQLRKFLRAAPNLTEIHVKTLNKHMMEFISKNHLNLKDLFYEHVEEEVLEFYEQEIKISTEINKNIKLTQKSFWFNNEIPFSLDPIFWRKE